MPSVKELFFTLGVVNSFTLSMVGLSVDLLSPVYTIQPVVKSLSNRFDNQLYHVYSQLLNRLYNPV